MNIESVKSLMDEGWIDKLSPFLVSEEFDKIIHRLRIENVKSGNKVLPSIDYLFRAFKVCKYNDLKLIICGQDPYFTKGVADGLAMSCSLTRILQPSIKMFYDEINGTVYDNEIDISKYDPSLDYLASQGVLLINRALTVLEKTPRSHFDIWEKFMSFLFDIVASYNPGVPILFLGKDARYLEKYLTFKNNPLIYVEHPAAASYQRRSWNSEDCFNKINKILESNNGVQYRLMWMNENYGKQYKAN